MSLGCPDDIGLLSDSMCYLATKSTRQQRSIAGSPALQVAQILSWYNYVKQQKKLGLKNFYMATRSPALLLESCAVVVIDFFHFYFSGSNVVADRSQLSLLWIFISLLLFVLCHNVFQCNCIVSFWSISGWSREEVFVWVWLRRAVWWMDGCHHQGQVGLYTIFFFFLSWLKSSSLTSLII